MDLSYLELIQTGNSTEPSDDYVSLGCKNKHSKEIAEGSLMIWKPPLLGFNESSLPSCWYKGQPIDLSKDVLILILMIGTAYNFTFFYDRCTVDLELF